MVKLKNKNKKIAKIWTDFDESQRPEGENKEDWIEILDYESKKKLFFKINYWRCLYNYLYDWTRSRYDAKKPNM